MSNHPNRGRMERRKRVLRALSRQTLEVLSAYDCPAVLTVEGLVQLAAERWDRAAVQEEINALIERASS